MSLLRLALFQPDIPQNTGTMLRMAACLGIDVDLIEPAGFPTSDRHFRRSGMDYLDQVSITRHVSWQTFEQQRREKHQRLVLLTTKAATPHIDFCFQSGDILMVGRESSGVPDSVHAAADARLIIPMRAEVRSLNVAIAAALVAGEALRQLSAWPCAISNRNGSESTT